MKLQRLTLLLLGGCISVTGLGCAALQATFESPRPVSDSRDVTGQRLVAIARVFENQGKYERAETMYRRALRHTPTDTVVRERIEQLVARRQGRQFRGTPSATAIAAADSVNGSRSRTASLRPPVVEPRVAELKPEPEAQNAVVTAAGTNSSDVPAVEVASQSTSVAEPATTPTETPQEPAAEAPTVDWAEIAPLPPELPQDADDTEETLVAEEQTLAPPELVETDLIDLAEVEPAEPPATSPVLAWEEPELSSPPEASGRAVYDLDPEQVEPKVNEVLPPEEPVTHVAVAEPQPIPVRMDNVALLIRTLEEDNLLEERAIAAVLLGDCPRDDIRVQIALDHCCEYTRDLTILQAVCDSQIQRGEQTRRTAECLNRIATRADDTALRVQAVSALRHFAGTQLEAGCQARLFRLLGADEEQVRSAAALTLGDYPTGDGETISQLTLTAANDADAEVRHAALSAMVRIGEESGEAVEVIGVSASGTDRGHQSIEIVPAR